MNLLAWAFAVLLALACILFGCGGLLAPADGLEAGAIDAAVETSTTVYVAPEQPAPRSSASATHDVRPHTPPSCPPECGPHRVM